MKPMKALSMPSRNVSGLRETRLRRGRPSLAPVVMVTSVSGFRVRPKNGEYAAATAAFNRGLPCKSLAKRLCSSRGMFPYLGRRILVAIDSVQCFFGSINDELRRVVATVDQWSGRG